MPDTKIKTKIGDGIIRDMINGHLPVYPDDPDDLIIVARDPDTGKLGGWIRAGDGKTDEYWRQNGRPSTN